MNGRDLTRAVWHRLPVWLRRPLAHGVLSVLAPPLPKASAESCAANAPVIVVGFLSSASGLGQAARLAYTALERQGRRVFGVDLSANFFETSEAVRFAFTDGRTYRGPARVLININAPYMKYVFRLLGGRFLKGRRVTGYFAWELERAPEAWREGLASVHDVATPSAFVAGAIKALGGVPRVHVAPHPVALEDIPRLPLPAAPPDRTHPFTIAFAMNAASGWERKNPLGLIAAFRLASKGRADWRLQLLISNLEHYAPAQAVLNAVIAEDSRIVLTTQTLDRPAYWRWFGAPDLYASLHRAEGFGLSLAEAMVAGVPVLATHWSANAEFMHERNSLPVRYKLIPVEDPQQKYVAGAGRWAEPDIAHAAYLMARAYAEPDWRLVLANTARAEALARWSTFPL